MNEPIVIDTEVERREEGLVITLYFDNGTVEEHSMSIAEARDIRDQLANALEAP